MDIVIDTSALIAVIAGEPERNKIVELTTENTLIGPGSIPWEIGNAFSAMFKRKRITLDQVKAALKAYNRIPIRLSNVDLSVSIDLATKLEIYAYDAYVIACALKHKCSILTLDKGLADAARKSGVKIREEIL